MSAAAAHGGGSEPRGTGSRVTSWWVCQWSTPGTQSSPGSTVGWALWLPGAAESSVLDSSPGGPGRLQCGNPREGLPGGGHGLSCGQKGRGSPWAAFLVLPGAAGCQRSCTVCAAHLLHIQWGGRRPSRAVSRRGFCKSAPGSWCPDSLGPRQGMVVRARHWLRMHGRRGLPQGTGGRSRRVPEGRLWPGPAEQTREAEDRAQPHSDRTGLLSLP